MLPKITESHSDCGVNVGKIIRRIIKYAPQDSLQDLIEVKTLDKDPDTLSFARYIRADKRIEIFIDDIVGWQPWLLKKSYFFPYLTIGMALGHEIDHHVNRDMGNPDRERSAESNALKYVYPSFGIFKPLVKLISFIWRPKKSSATA
jgi:hypothetical protein